LESAFAAIGDAYGNHSTLCALRFNLAPPARDTVQAGDAKKKNGSRKVVLRRALNLRVFD
jgi:hypothetical protein